MGFYSSQVPDFRQAVEAILADHGLIADPTATEPAGEQAQPADQPEGQHADPSSQPA